MARDELNGTAAAPPSPAGRTVVIHVVTFNHHETIVQCLESALSAAEQLASLEPAATGVVRVTDNASTDETADVVRRKFGQQVELTANTVNLGFSAAHNLAIARAVEEQASYVLVLNPDLRLDSAAVALLVSALDQDPAAGTACPKLLRADAQLEPVAPARFDSAGMFMTPALRHFDRGSNELDSGQYDKPQYVFGATGACALFKRDFLLDIAISFKRNDGRLTLLEVFDEDFFAYREDADLAWRAQRCGWRCLYLPDALGYHKRAVLPENRGEIGEKINAWSVRNRFLMQWADFSLISNLHCLLPGLWRNLLVVGGVLAYEHGSISGLVQAIRLIPKSLDKRRIVFRRRRIPEARLARWFNFAPYAEPALVKKRLPDMHAIESARSGVPGAAAASSPLRTITAIIVNYNSGERLKRALSSLTPAIKQLAPRLDLKIVVVDNGSADQSLVAAGSFESEEGIEFLRLGRNFGFGGGMNRGARHRLADSYLLLNPDVEIDAAQTANLAGVLDRYESLAAVAPLLFPPVEAAEQSVQRRYAAKSFPTAGSLLAELFYLHRLWPENPWTAAQYLIGDTAVEAGLGGRGSDPIVVEQPAAACLLVRGSAFHELNGFDERFFPAWFEDVDLLKRLAASGYAAAFYPGASAVHAGGYSKDGLAPAEFAAIWYRNLGRYITKHFCGAKKAALSLCLRLALVLRAAVEFIRGLFGAGRAARETAAVMLQFAMFGLEYRAPAAPAQNPLPEIDAENLTTNKFQQV